MTASLSARIREEARRLGFELVGLAPLRASDHAAFYRRWLEQGHHGTMDYLARDDDVAARLDPTSRWPELRSAVVVGHFYSTAVPPSPHPPVSPSSSGPGDQQHAGDDPATRNPAYADIARYAKGRDYHRVVKNKLLALLHWLENELGERLPEARAYVDTGPVLERDLARRAGLGWFGRNTMLIHPRKGSYFFLGELLLPLELEYDEPFEADRCGSCRACLDACPTGALLGPDADGAPVLNANLCISYLTIENRGPIPEQLRPAMGNHVFGCDVCQEVCPWNGEKRLKVAAEPDYAARGPGQAPHGVGPESSTSARFAGTDSPSLIELLRTALDPDAWDAFSRGSAIRRAGRVGFARNVCVGLGNWGAESAVAVLRSALSDPGPVVRAHAAWALGRVGSRDAASALSARSASEEDASVLEEVRAALDV